MKHKITTQQPDQKSDPKSGPRKTSLAALAHSFNQRAGQRYKLFSPGIFLGISGPAAHMINILPRSVLVIDWRRLPDPTTALAENNFTLPRNATILIRAAPQPRPLADYIRVARAARAHGYHVLAAAALRGLPQYLITGRHIGEAAHRFPASCGWGLGRGRGSILTFAVHDQPGLRRAAHWGAGAVFLSPFFTTASHPDQPALTSWQAHDLCRRSRVPVVALGGVNTTTMRRLGHTRIIGLAGLDGWRQQKILPSNASQV